MENATFSWNPMSVMKIKKPFHHDLLLLLISIAHFPLDYFDITFTAFVTVLMFSKGLNSWTFILDACVTTTVTYHAILLAHILHKVVHL